MVDRVFLPHPLRSDGRTLFSKKMRQIGIFTRKHNKNPIFKWTFKPFKGNTHFSIWYYMGTYKTVYDSSKMGNKKGPFPAVQYTSHTNHSTEYKYVFLYLLGVPKNIRLKSAYRLWKALKRPFETIGFLLCVCFVWKIPIWIAFFL